MDNERIFIRTRGDADRPAEYRRGRVTPPVLWVIAGVLLVMIAAAAVWFFAGTVTNTVSVWGVVFPQSGIEQVTSHVDGTVSYVQVGVGDNVEAGDLIAVVPQTALLERIRLARAGDAGREELEELYRAYTAASLICTPVAGRVVDIARTGQSISAGDLVVSVAISDKSSNEAEIRAYVPMSVAQTVKKGMTVRVYPAGEQYGYIRGLVSDILPYPITGTDISQELGRFFVSDDVPVGENITEIRVTLLIGSEESTLKDESAAIDIGTRCRMEVVVSELKPWEALSSR